MFRFREVGFMESIKFYYETWNTRWMAMGLMNLVWLVKHSVDSLLPYHLISLLLLWLAFMRLTFNFIAEIKTAAILSGYLTVSLFYSCFSIADVFFWINTSTMYLYGCIAAIFGVAEVTGKRKEFYRTSFWCVPEYMPVPLMNRWLSFCCWPEWHMPFIPTRNALQRDLNF
ncbi:MAG: hypothetical protein IPG39_14725 [Bacteroidetes bacterium]|nr:hypothetical protein [Bacteroidota bacterium]